jgi:hypothetical protein
MGAVTLTETVPTLHPPPSHGGRFAAHAWAGSGRSALTALELLMMGVAEPYRVMSSAELQPSGAWRLGWAEQSSAPSAPTSVVVPLSQRAAAAASTVNTDQQCTHASSELLQLPPPGRLAGSAAAAAISQLEQLRQQQRVDHLQRQLAELRRATAERRTTLAQLQAAAAATADATVTERPLLGTPVASLADVPVAQAIHATAEQVCV